MRNMSRNLNQELINGGMPSLGASAMGDVAWHEQMGQLQPWMEQEMPALTPQPEPIQYS
jgi:hypothetical protein